MDFPLTFSAAVTFIIVLSCIGICMVQGLINELEGLTLALVLVIFAWGLFLYQIKKVYYNGTEQNKGSCL